MGDTRYTLKEFADIVQVSVKTLQRWDYQGTLTAYRNPSGRRYYTQAHLDKLKNNEKELEHKSSAMRISKEVVKRALREKVSREQSAFKKVNQKYKDKLFILRFGSKEYLKDTLSLYNAINKTDYNDTRQVELTTLSDVIYIRMKNDVSFLLDGNMVLWEHQSTINPNMPLRGVMYFGELFSQYVSTHGVKIFSKQSQNVPTPRYIVFYNGQEDWKVKELKLSDLFEHKTDNVALECVATVYNINKDKELLKACKPLQEYTTFVSRIQNNTKKMHLKNAIDEAVEYCINNDVMKEFLIKHKSEVVNVCLTEFNEELYKETLREDAYVEGHAEGLAEGEAIGIEKGEVIGRIGALKDFNFKDEEIIKAIKKKYNLSDDKALEFLKEWYKRYEN